MSYHPTLLGMPALRVRADSGFPRKCRRHPDIRLRPREHPGYYDVPTETNNYAALACLRYSSGDLNHFSLPECSATTERSGSTATRMTPVW